MTTDKKNGAPIVAYKGFNRDWTCRGYQYKVGEVHEHEDKTEACESGFHACEYPLDVFSYYAPSQSVFAIVEASGDLDRKGDDSKIASSKLTVKAEIGIAVLVKAAIEYTVSRTKPNKSKKSNSDEGQGAASATGDYGAALATGYQGAASATGDYGAASATGDYGAASATGGRGAASATGLHSVAMGAGWQSKAMADETGAIVLVYRNMNDEIIHIRASKVGENGIKSNVWYSLNDKGEFVEVEA